MIKRLPTASEPWQHVQKQYRCYWCLGDTFWCPLRGWPPRIRIYLQTQQDIGFPHGEVTDEPIPCSSRASYPVLIYVTFHLPLTSIPPWPLVPMHSSPLVEYGVTRLRYSWTTIEQKKKKAHRRSTENTDERNVSVCGVKHMDGTTRLWFRLDSIDITREEIQLRRPETSVENPVTISSKFWSPLK